MRPILTVRNKGTEQLLSSMPYEVGDDLSDLRRWSEAMMNAAGRHQIDKAKKNMLARNGSAVRRG